ncbi:MAG: acyl-CoA dehydrogenase family protein [Mycobacterium sp.]
MTIEPDADEDFRAELREWFASHPPPRTRRHPAGLSTDPDAQEIAELRRWQKQAAEAGYSGVAWPRDYGGRDASPLQQLIFHEELQRVGGAASLFFVGLSHAGPTLIEHGTDAQRRQWLPGILSGDIIFAQCFSEPGAGSDLAAISTRGVVDGDDLVVTGQKRWSTRAQHADLCELLVRTDPSDRYGGLTYLIADLRAPGVTVRPIRSITGAAEFCEIFFDDARIPLSNLIGEIGGGWAVANTTLMYERSTAFAPTIIGLQYVVADLAKACAHDAVLRQRADELADDVFAARALLYRCVAEQQADGAPGPAGGALKLIATELNHRIRRLRALIDPDGVLDYLESFGLRIGGGTSEIQRNIIAERILGLPKEPRR